MCRLLPRSRGLPRFAGGSASAPLLSRPAQALLTLRPVGSLNRPRRPLSRGFDPVGYPAKPLVSYQSNRQLSGWNPPPLVVRAIGAHCKYKEFCNKTRVLKTNRFSDAEVWCEMLCITGGSGAALHLSECPHSTRSGLGIGCRFRLF